MIFLKTTAIFITGLFAAENENLINYDLLTHEVIISELRAGNHDESGTNEYFFRITTFGMPITKAEVGKKFEDRKKVTQVIGEFGHATVKNLSFHEPGEKPNMKMPGDIFRQVTSRTMREFEIAEDRVALLARIEMFETNKELFFFGEDVPIGATEYFVVPETLPHIPDRKNIKLTIRDEIGTSVKFLINYKIKKTKQRIIE